MPKKRQRENELTKSYEDYVIDNTNEEIIQSKEDKELFVIDRLGSKSSRKKLKKEEVLTQNNFKSLNEKKLIERKMNQISVSNGNKQQRKEKKSQIVDLWNDNDRPSQSLSNVLSTSTTVDTIELTTPSTKKNKSIKKNKSALKIPIPGISYNPAHVDHQDALAEAVALTLQHEEEKVRQSLQFLAPSKFNSNSQQNNDNENTSQHSELESDDENNNDSYQLSSNGIIKKHKQPQRKTRTQRNKEKRRKQLKYERYLNLKEQTLMKNIDKIPKHLENIEKEKEIHEIKKKSIEILKKETEDKIENNMTYSDAATVPLTEELNGSLRCIKPLGLSVAEQANSMRKVGNMNDRMKARNKKKGEKLHPQKRVKWIPKYKYTTLSQN